jgi:thioesterase domain-containing protein
VFDYETLARRLDGEVPVLGLQCRMLLDPAWQDSSIQAMAQDYARHVRARQERGPYRLLGWSLGGSLAVLVARLLEDQGQTVELCGVVDPYVPGEPETGIAWRDELAAFLRFTLPHAGEPDPALLDQLQDQGDTAALAQLIGRHIAGAPAGSSPAAEELAQMFAVALRLRALSEAMPPLPRIAAEPTSWWLRGRESARRLFREQTGRPGRMRELDGTHFGLLRDPALLEGVAGALAATLEPA